MDLTFMQLGALAASALIVGFSKTGVQTSGILAVTIMASAFAAKQSVGMLLPMLIIADVVAVIYYRRQVVWKHLIVLIPWVLLGIITGYVFMFFIEDIQLKLVIGLLVLFLVMLQLYRSHSKRSEPASGRYAAWFGSVMGILAGFTTMVGNAAGGVMAIYLISKKLPKEQFIGTGAWFFLIVNLIKVPFNFSLVTITFNTLLMNAAMIPVILAGAWVGIKIVPRLSQVQFQNIVLTLSALGALQLIISALIGLWS